MSIFNRKLFTRAPYDHYGTGIASGLVERQGFAVGGRVNYAKGGDSSDFDTDAVLKRSSIIGDKKQLFEGDFGLGIRPESSSTISNAYNIKFRNKLNSLNITSDQYSEFRTSDKELLTEKINDEIIKELKTEYNISPQDIYRAFGGANMNKEENDTKKIKQMEKGSEVLARNGDKYLDRLITNNKNEFTQGQAEEMNQRYSETLGSQLENIKTNNPQAFDPVGIMSSGVATDDIPENDEPNPEITSPPNMNQGLGDKSLMGMDRTTDEFRQGYMDNLREAQDELGLADKRRQQMRSQSLINMGAADPVQKGESFMQMAAKSFADPMKELYAAENLRDEDIYKRYGDRTDAAYDPNEKAAAQVQLADYFIGKGIPEQEVLAIMTGSSDREMDLLNNPVVIEAMGEYMSNNPTASILDAKNNVLRGMIPSNITDNTITNPIITAPTNSVLANGGRVGLNQGGRVGLNLGGTPSLQQNMQQPLQSSMQQSAPEQSEQMTFQELREQLPDYINDDVVRLLVQSPEALLDLSEAKTADDLDRFEQKYNVQVTMPAAENEATTDGML